MESGIYKIVNKVNGKVYVGSAVNLPKRKGEHFSALNNNNHVNRKLQNSFNKYTKENFEFEVVQYCEKEILIEREQYYIDELNPWYNILRIAGSSLGFKQSEETINKIRVRVFTKEHRERLSMARKKRVTSQTTRDRMSVSTKKTREDPEMIERYKEVIRNRPLLICPYCNYSGYNKGSIMRVHFENCKNK